MRTSKSLKINKKTIEGKNMPGETSERNKTQNMLLKFCLWFESESSLKQSLPKLTASLQAFKLWGFTMFSV